MGTLINTVGDEMVHLGRVGEGNMVKVSWKEQSDENESKSQFRLRSI